MARPTDLTEPDLATWLGIPHGEPGMTSIMLDQLGLCLDAAVADLEARCDLPAAWPDNVRVACLMHAARLYKRKASPEGVAGFGEFGAVRVTKLDPDVERLVAPYLTFGFA